MDTTTIQPGNGVYSGGGRFMHIARSATTTVCGKPITRFSDANGLKYADCYVCQRRSDHRR